MCLRRVRFERSMSSGTDGSFIVAKRRSISIPEKTKFMMGVWASGTF